jgi:hypothetical protein
MKIRGKEPQAVKVLAELELLLLVEIPRILSWRLSLLKPAPPFVNLVNT